MGLLQGVDLSDVQVTLLIANKVIEADREGKQIDAAFKRDLFIANPDLYNELYNKKKDETDDDNIEWKVPSSPEEAAEIAKLFEQNALQGSSNTGLVFDEWIGTEE